MFCTFFFQDFKCFCQLCFCHAIFCITRVIHDVVTYLEYTTGIKTTAYCFGNSCQLFKVRNMCKIIEVNDCTHFSCFNKVFCGSYVGREHDIMSFATNRFCHHQFCQGRAVCTTAFFLQHLQNTRCGGCFYSEIFSKSFVPGKCLIYFSCIFTDSFFIIDMKRCRILFDNFFCLF